MSEIRKHNEANASDSPDGIRKGSLKVDTTLASEADAAVLAKMGCVPPPNQMISDTNSGF